MLELPLGILEEEAEFEEGALKSVSARTAVLGLAEIQHGLIKLQSSFYYLVHVKHLQTSTDMVFTGPSYSHFSFFLLSHDWVKFNIGTVCIFSFHPEDASFSRTSTQVSPGGTWIWI